jgi:hypothetical protein
MRLMAGELTRPPIFADEDLLSVSLDWTDTNGHAARMLSDVEIDRSGTDSAVVPGVFDGGGGPLSRPRSSLTRPAFRVSRRCCRSFGPPTP